jgi:hypothetical protein
MLGRESRRERLRLRMFETRTEAWREVGLGAEIDRPVHHQLTVTVPTRYPPHISLEKVDRDEVVVRIGATPDRPGDGAELADQILSVARRADGAEPSSDGR